ncbi:MAG: hypothetical protein K0R54_1003 [Clostridiaceae bacterium]|nr:hypothetical protein [Clostridiaceae bacterium]
MKITAVKAVLTGQDILGILNEYVIVEGLKFEKIEINELITVYGSYKKGITIPFKAQVGIGNIIDNTVNLKIFNINVMKIGMLNLIKNLALKTSLKDFYDVGIKVNKDNIAVNLGTISKLVPYVYFKLNKVNIVQETIEAEVEEVIYAKNKETIKFEKKKKKVKDCIKDNYSNLRHKVEENVPDKYEKLAEYALIIPDIVVLFYRLFKDKRIGMKNKLLIGGITAYLASPIDILPDFIPFIGKVDDIAIAFFGLNAIINEVPENVILENWQGEEDIVLMVKEAVKYISQVVGAKNIDKLINLIKGFHSKKSNEENMNKEYQEM